MSYYELQLKKADHWKIVDAYKYYDDAYASALRLERKNRDERVRICHFDEGSSGTERVRTIYEGGRSAQRERALQTARDQQDAYLDNLAKRRAREMLAEQEQSSIKTKERVRMQTSPLYVVVVLTSLSVAAVAAALYLLQSIFLRP